MLHCGMFINGLEEVYYPDQYCRNHVTLLDLDELGESVTGAYALLWFVLVKLDNGGGAEG